jgi:hypothetical protein
MVDIHSPGEPLTVSLPADLIAELRTLAAEKRISLDEVVREACLAYTEPYYWERTYKDWRHAHPHDLPREFGLDGEELGPASSGEVSA